MGSCLGRPICLTKGVPRGSPAGTHRVLGPFDAPPYAGVRVSLERLIEAGRRLRSITLDLRNLEAGIIAVNRLQMSVLLRYSTAMYASMSLGSFSIRNE